MAAKPSIVLVGAGGHGRVVADVIAASGRYALAGATDAKIRSADGLKILGGDDVLPGLLKKGVRLAAVGVGSVRDTAARRALREKLAALGFRLPALVHPTAVVAKGVALGDGAQVMARCVINPGATLGRGVVVNTGAVVEHDVVLEDDSFVGPGAVVGGEVRVGAGAFVGLGAAVKQGVTIGARAVVGAGAAVVADVPPGAVVTGVPARSR